MERSAGRRMYLDFVGPPCGPCSRFGTRSGRSAVRQGLRRRPLRPRTVQTAVRHLRRRIFPLRVSPPVADAPISLTTSLPSAGSDRTRIRHEVLESLLCHPSSAVHYRVSVPSDSDFVTSCALSPNAWRHHAGAVDFRVRLEIPKAGGRLFVECRLDPAGRYTDRRWHQLRIPLPPLAEPAAEVMVSLETDVAPGSDAGHALGLFGEPRFEWKRPQAEVRASVDGSSSSCETMDGARPLRGSRMAARQRKRQRSTRSGSLLTRARNLSSKPTLPVSPRCRFSLSSASSPRCSTLTPGGSGRASSRSAARPTRTGSCVYVTTHRARQDPRKCSTSTPTIRASASSGVRTTPAFRSRPTPRPRSREA